MPKKNRDTDAEILSTLKDILIVLLTQASVPQPKIREILGIDIAKVSRVAKVIRESKSKGE